MNRACILGSMILLVACSSREHPRASGAHDTSSVDSSTLGLQLITGTSLAGVNLCDPLTRVDSVFPAARDTVVTSEGEGWPSRIVALSPDAYMLFESSWADTLHVWRISTNSTRFQSRGGLRVGQTIDRLIANGDSLEFEYPEGGLALNVPRDSVGFLVDDRSTAEFSRRFDYHSNPRTVLSPRARITSLVIVADCRRSSGSRLTRA